MQSFWGLIPRNIIKHKKRNFFMAIGIVLSISLITSLSIISESLNNYIYESMVDGAGGIHDIDFITKTKYPFDTMKSDSVIDKFTVATPIGQYDIPNSQNNIQIFSYDENATKILNFKLIEGEYPKTNNEVALESWILDELPNKYRIGDVIKLNTVLQYTDGGKKKVIENNHELKLVGVFEYIADSFSNKNMGRAYVTKDYGDEIIGEEKVEHFGYICLNPKYSITDGLMTLIRTSDYRDIFFRESSFKKSIEIFTRLIGFIIKALSIIIGIISSIIIYNIFNLSVAERIREFGMLRAIGISKSEIKLLVLGEGILLGVIFIPIGILLGNLVMKIPTMSFLKYKDLSGIFYVPKSGILLSLVIGFFSIILGVYFSAKRASSVSPIEAITSNNNLNLKGKKIKQELKSSKFLIEESSFETKMAYINLKRNKKKFITTVLSLSIIIIMFITGDYLLKAANPINRFKENFDSDFLITTFSDTPGNGLTEENIKGLSNVKGGELLSKTKSIISILDLEEGQLTEDGKSYIKSKSRANKFVENLAEQKTYRFQATMKGYDGKDLEKLKSNILEGKIDIKEMGNEPVAIVVQNLNYYNFTNIKVGDVIKVSYPNYDDKGNEIGLNTQSFIVGALIDEEPLKNVDPMEKMQIIISDRAAEKYFKLKEYQQVKFNVNKNADYESVEKSLKENLKSFRSMELKSYKKELEKIKNQNKDLIIILYTFIFIVASISAINLINVMNMNVMLRKKEIGMLRALGLGTDEVKKMIRTEGLFYGVFAGMIGVTCGTIMTIIIYIIGKGKVIRGISWNLPIISILVALITTIILCLIAAILPAKSLFKSNIVDSIRSIE